MTNCHHFSFCDERTGPPSAGFHRQGDDEWIFAILRHHRSAGLPLAVHSGAAVRRQIRRSSSASITQFQRSRRQRQALAAASKARRPVIARHRGTRRSYLPPTLEDAALRRSPGKWRRALSISRLFSSAQMQLIRRFSSAQIAS